MLIIGICGGTGSGKTTVVNKILDILPANHVAILSQDSYYKDSSNISVEERKSINFDHPDAIEFDLLLNDNIKLKANEDILDTFNHMMKADVHFKKIKDFFKK